MDAQFINAIPANGAKLFTYAAGSTTKQTTFTDSTGLVANPNPIILNSRGEPPNPIWLTSGQTYKFVFTNSTDTDPPTSPIRTIDNISGVNDTSLLIDQWVSSSSAPTYINATTFSVSGDKTSDFQVNRRLKLSVTAGTVYGYIVSSAYTTLTTVVIALDSGNLDSGLSSVSLGLLTPNNPSIPAISDNIFAISKNVSAAIKAIFSLTNLTATRTITLPDKSGTLAMISDLPAVQTRTVLTSGSGTYTLPANCKYIRVRGIGGGGGGGGSGTSVAPASGNGGNTTFGAITASGGTGGAWAANGGAGGASSLGGLGTGIALQGGDGQGSTLNNSGFINVGGYGAGTPFIGPNAKSQYNSAGNNGVANTGQGGQGGSQPSVNTSYTGSGGGAGGYFETLITSPAASYSYAVGGSGTGATAGGSGFAGGNGGSGIIIVEEFY